MSRTQKRLLIMTADAVLVSLALWGAFALRLGDVTPEIAPFWWLFLLMPLISLPVFHLLGFYRMIIRYMGPHAVFALLKGVTLSALCLAAITLLLGLYAIPRSVLPLYWLLGLLGVGGVRFLVRAWLQSASRHTVQKKPVIIYGAGSSGAQLANALISGREFHPVAMLDDDPSLKGSMIGGLKVFVPKSLPQLIEEYDVEEVLLAIPSASRLRRKEILHWLEQFPVHVKTIPRLTDLVSGQAKLDQIREVDVEDLLGRDPVAPDPALMSACIRGKTVMVTGAGGSIGAELCRQILAERPRRLVLFELSEYNLYRIDQELRMQLVQMGEAGTELVPLLGSVTDPERLRRVLQAFAVDTVYHAAAYKHVPIVEHNIIEGVRNNALGTWYAADAAREAGVEHFVLISTDKAVRPTNVMGATKRMAEMVLQSIMTQPGSTNFCMVRFGNVLGSSGSVVPLFRRQIERGGPVTVTHPEITRYFMTIPEAASLVIQAGSMARGGEVFVLDMGEPVRIIDLARKMIHLMGHQVCDETGSNACVDIKITGLRPGEKLYEELLIGDNVAGTAHPKIHCADEWAPSWGDMQELLQAVERAVEAGDCERVRDVLLKVVSGYTANPQMPDLLWNQRVLEHATAEPASVTSLPVRRRGPPGAVA